MESGQSNKRPHSGDENVGGKRGKFSGRGREGGDSFRGFAGGRGEGQRGRGFRGGRGGFRGGRGGEGGGFRGGRGGEGGGFRGGRGGEGGGFRGGRGGEGGGFRGGRGGFRGGRGGFRGGEGGGFRGGRGGFRDGEGGGFRGGRGGFRDGEGGGFRRRRSEFRDGEGGGFRGGRGGFRGGRGGFRGGRGGFRGGRGGMERESRNGAIMKQGSGQKVYADFPDWDADLIHEVLTAVLHQKPEKGYWNKISDRLNNVKQPNEIEELWNKLITKLEPPTFQCGLDLIKRLLKRTVNIKKVPELDGLPRRVDSTESYIQKEYFKQFPEKRPSNEPGQIRKLQLTPSEKFPYYVTWTAKKNKSDLLWFNYLKDHPEEYQEWSNVEVMEKWY